jgi:lysozyme
MVLLASAAATVVSLKTSQEVAHSSVPDCRADPAYASSYFGARYYSAQIGRFTTVDPVMTISANLVDPQRWNRYAYARNNPLSFLDPSGRCTKAADAKSDTPADSICGDPGTLKPSAKLTGAITANEEVKLTAYIGPEGYNKDGTKNGRGLTVGVGHLVTAGDNLKEGDTITQEQAAAFLEVDLATSAAGVRRALGTTQVSQREFDALVDLSFNAGPNIFSSSASPRLLTAIASADYGAMGNELRYTQANGATLQGLVYRSDQRQNIFLNGIYSAVTGRR